MGALIEADGLGKRFGKVQALSDLTLTLPSGQPVAILGPNGAGKTTFIRMIATLIEPDRGTLRVERARRRARSDGGAAHDRPGRPVRRGRGDDDGAGEPVDGGPPVRPGEEGGGGLGCTDPRADGSGGRGGSPGAHVLGRHAAAARPRRQPGRGASAAAARRADDGARPGQSQRGVGRHPRDGVGRDRHVADDAVSR